MKCLRDNLHSFIFHYFFYFTEYPNLNAYYERMKTEFWPDWDECITHGDTRKASK